MESGYKVCEKCGVRYSTLTRHKKCFKPDEQKDPPKFENPPPGDGDDGEQGDGQGKPGEGEGEQDGEGQGEGEGEPDEKEGEGEGEGGAEGEPPPPPEPTAMEMVTLLRFAALSAREATAFIKVEVTYDGLAIFASTGDDFAEAKVPWESLIKLETAAAEGEILEAIRGVDFQLTGSEWDPDKGKEVAIEDWKNIEFLTGHDAHLWATDDGDRVFVVGIPPNKGSFSMSASADGRERRPELVELIGDMSRDNAHPLTRSYVSSFLVVVDEFGYATNKDGERRQLIRER